MEYRILGNTGLKVSALSLGASSLGGVFKPVDESQAIRTVHTALELGINFIDVSPFYGYTMAEEVPAAWHHAPKDVRQACASAAAYSRRQGTDIAKLAMQISLRSIPLSSAPRTRRISKRT